MKRHPSLIPLSREHHGSLLLARLLQKNAPEYKGLPSDVEGKRKYAIDLYLSEIRSHFEKEENILRSVDHYEVLRPLIIEIFEEHNQLSRMFELLMKSGDKDELDQLGLLLEKHIRKEERQLFPLMEETCTLQELERLKDLL